MPPNPRDRQSPNPHGGNGIYFVGDKGTIVFGGWSGSPALYPASRRDEFKRDEFKRPEKTSPRSIGHRADWIQACKDQKPEDAKAGFDYSGPFTEALLVGNLAVLQQKRVESNAKEMISPNVLETDRLVQKVPKRF